MSPASCTETCRGEGAKMKPTADAPRLTESSASASDVMPQILTKRSSLIAPRRDARPARAAGPDGRPPAPASRRPGSRRSPASASRRASAASRIPDSATATTSGGIRAASAHARSWSTSNVRRSRWFTPTSAAPAASARASSASSCTSTSAARPSSSARAAQAASSSSVERGHDQEHGVGPHQAGIGDVGLLHGEVLAQDGQARGLAGRPGRPSTRRRSRRRSAPTGRRRRRRRTPWPPGRAAGPGRGRPWRASGA